MSETDFRTAYDALVEKMPDPPSFERIRAQSLRPKSRRVAGWQVATISAVAVLVSIGGGALLTGGPPQAGETAEAAEARMAEAIAGLGGLCDESSTTADFVGDGEVDAVTIGIPECDTRSDPQDPTMIVSWSSGDTESWDLVQCGVAQPEGPVTPTGICEVFATPDLNDDGRAELAVKVQEAAGSIVLLQFYSVTPDEPAQTPIRVAPGGPGPGDITPGQVGALTYGSSPDYENNIRCTTDRQGEPIFLVTVAESQDGQWSVFEGTWHYDGRLMDFRSQRTYSISKDSPDASRLIAGDSICGAPIPEETQTGLDDLDMVLTYPRDWHLAEESLTPNLDSPTEVFSLGSFPLKPGGPTCAQIPSQALHDMEATDVFVTVQERGSNADASGFSTRPDTFGPTPGSADHVFYDCLEPAERDHVGEIHWIWFTEQDRYFHVLVALGRDTAAEDVSSVWNVLNQLEIKPRD
jgi:hypothetical protein